MNAEESVGDEEIDRLYSLPLEEFTGARNVLAARLGREGKREQAKHVRGLRRPTLAAWTVNQLVRRRRHDVDALLEAGVKLREQQQAVLLGDTSTDGLREATEAARSALESLVESARSELDEQGRRATDATVEAVARTLRAAAFDPEAGELLAQGRLTREVESVGFDALAGMVLPAERGRGRGTKQASEKRPAATRAQERRIAALTERVAGLRQATKEAETKANRAEREAGKLRKLAERERSRLVEAEAKLAAERASSV
jgi:hypothetical protein